MQRDSARIFNLVAVMALVLAVASCTKPKKSDADGGAEGLSDSSATTAPTVSDKDIGIDSQGSDSGRINGLKTVFFEFDQARLSSQARKDLAGNAEWMRSNPNFTIQIEGHTDSRGSTEYNLSLGERRAKSVRQYLESLGVESRRLSIISYGEEKPMDVAENETAWGKNRRANFVPLQ